MPPALSALSAAALLLLGPAPVVVAVPSEPDPFESVWSPPAFCVVWAGAGAAVEPPAAWVGVDEGYWLA